MLSKVSTHQRKYARYEIIFEDELETAEVELLSKLEGRTWNMVASEVEEEIEDEDAPAAPREDDLVAAQAVAAQAAAAVEDAVVEVPVVVMSADRDADPVIYGRFRLSYRINVDQVPLHVIDAVLRTNASADEIRVHACIPASWKGRLASLNIMIRADGTFDSVCLVFSGRSEHRLSKRYPRRPHLVELEEYARSLGVTIIWQPNAWMDGAACNLFITKHFAQQLGAASADGVKKGHEKFLLFADNLGGQATGIFSSLARDHANTLVWMLPPNCTDSTQPIDSGIGKTFKTLLKHYFWEWMMTELPHPNDESTTTILQLACDPDATIRACYTSADVRRRKIIEWVAQATTEMRTPRRRQQIRRAFEKTGCSMRADGVYAGIEPEGTRGYTVHDA